MTRMTDADYLYFREFSYDLFRRLFMEEPTPELIQFLQQQDLFSLFPYLQDDPQFTDAAENISGYLASSRFMAGEEAFENLHWDFTRLFIGPEKPPAPPWESVYVSRDRLLFQRCTHEVNEIYKRNGFVLGDGESEAADHIGFELDFLYRQSGLTLSLFTDPANERELTELLKQQLDFLQQHLLAFSDAFSQNVRQHAETVFYRNFSVILSLFLNVDQQQLQRLIAVAG